MDQVTNTNQKRKKSDNLLNKILKEGPVESRRIGLVIKPRKFFVVGVEITLANHSGLLAKKFNLHFMFT